MASHEGMPDTSLSSSPSTQAPDLANRANSPSNTPSAGLPASACQKPATTISQHTTPSHKSQASSSYVPALVALPKLNNNEMPVAVANSEARSSKINSSTNNLFSSSCQPMRNTPNGESYAKVPYLSTRADLLGLYRHFHYPHDQFTP